MKQQGVIRLRVRIGILMLLCSLVAASNPYAQVTRGQGVPAGALPEALRNLDVKDVFLASDLNRVGVIHALEGNVVVVHRSTNAAYFGKEGDPVYENDSLNTLADSRCRIRFVNEDVVTMAPDTVFAVENFVDQRGQGKKASLFSMIKGRAMFYAMRLFGYKDARFTLKTPTVTVGVRGTKFGAYVYWEKEKTAGMPDGILVADSGNSLGSYLAQITPEGKSYTDCHSEDGTLDVDGKTVGAGQMYRGEDGAIIPTPPGILQKFREATDIKKGEAKGEEGETLVQDTGEEDTLSRRTDIQEDVTNVTQTQTGIKSEEGKATEFTPLPPPLKGYFSALLLYKSSNWVRDAFASTSLQETDPLNDAYAYGVISSNNYIEADEVDNGAHIPAEGDVFLFGEGSSEDKDMEGTSNYLGRYTYLQWGYVTPSTFPEFTIGANTYEFANKFWFLEGYPTGDSQIAALSGQYSYSGVVHGTYHDSSGTVDLAGTYSSQVDFGSATIQNFSLNASGGAHNIDFTQSGTKAIDAHGQFTLHDPSHGTFNIDGSPVSYWAVNGAHFGSAAQEQGGAFAATCSSTNKSSWGVFAGQQN
ncbi:MAG: FecR domain-containing protein [Deltaproteobacteria bacterium]|nr:FecR domain-containing protein [Deltaproteobacteria bacterium]